MTDRKYKIVYTKLSEREVNVGNLNRLGEEGYEYSFTVQTGFSTDLYFERVEDTQDDKWQGATGS